MHWKSVALGHIAVAASLAFGTAQATTIPIGSVVLYSDGKAEKLLANQKDHLIWEDDRKRKYKRSRNPIIPSLTRDDFLSGRGYRRVIVTGDPDSIYSRPIGENIQFGILRTRHSGKKSTRLWDCSRRPNESSKVLGVKLELERFTCERSSVDKKSGKKKFREQKKFSYSPELGVIVEMRRKTRTAKQRWKLTRIIPPSETSYSRLSKQVRKLRKSD